MMSRDYEDPRLLLNVKEPPPGYFERLLADLVKKALLKYRNPYMEDLLIDDLPELKGGEE